ncbi:8-oxoguanine DNA glycosylase OGG fold protein [Kibdelosporangium aridum]|uniref:Uncharacterized protein n=1 Tax=Kibdelosporangium aridum TaxID=2030 RepID=A0A1W2FXT6_KIBAR|nr:hypothetical protein [Kibdelosporangium aridum]SMD26604.1 hypothetical protein SAMN05661093_10187 [Kibdelosporangium aridum]
MSPLALPPWAVPTQPRRNTIDNHSIPIRTQWWHDAIKSHGLPGPSPAGATLTRAEVWEPTSDVFKLLWRTLAWGSGSRLRQNARRLKSIAADIPRAENLLTEAAAASRVDPFRAYTLLRPGHRNEIKALGPSFFTKFLYFAGAGVPEHPCLILDRRVATALREHCGWTTLHPYGPWTAETYQRYCEQLRQWAGENGCAADELERILFDGKPKTEEP